MAQYKVPQDVEAEDKLLGPFTFRQFIYLMIAAGAIAMAWALFQVFPLLALLPVPVIIFFAVLALPLKKDQPMETYLAAVVSFYLKPRNHFWIPGQKESTIKITAPKKAEKPRARNITEEEAGHRLSFLADLIDTEGYSIKNVDSAVRDEYIAEANSITDVMDAPNNIMNQMIAQDSAERRQEVINQMRAASLPQVAGPEAENPVVIKSPTEAEVRNSAATVQPDLINKPSVPMPNPSKMAALENLATNKDFSVETIAKEAERINHKDDKEVYISLH